MMNAIGKVSKHLATGPSEQQAVVLECRENATKIAVSACKNGFYSIEVTDELPTTQVFSRTGPFWAAIAKIVVLVDAALEKLVIK